MGSITLESILSRINLTNAYKQVVGNRGAAGIDKMTYEELGDHLRGHWSQCNKGC